MEKNTKRFNTLKVGNINTIPTFDVDLERAVLHCILVDEKIQPNIYKLKEDDFYNTDNMEIFKLFVRIMRKEKIIDPALIDQEHRNGAYLDILGRVDALSSKWDYYFKRLRELSNYRRLQNISYWATMQVEEKRPIASIKNYLLAETGEIKEDTEVVNTEIIDDQFADMVDNQDLVAVRTGFPKLDRVCHGFLKSSFNVIASYPRAGKTTFALNMVDHICRVQGKSVLFVSLEMDYVELHAKLVSLLSGVDFDTLIFGNPTEEQMRKVNGARAQISQWKIDRMGDRETTPSDIEMRLKDKDIDIVFVDYLQLMKPNLMGKSIREDMSNLSRELKQVARRTGIPVVVISSVNRNYKDDKANKPKLFDLKETSQIEFDAGLVLLLHRESLFVDWDSTKHEMTQEEFEHHAQVLIAKNRFGVDSKECDMYFDGATSKIGEQYSQTPKRKDIDG